MPQRVSRVNKVNPKFALYAASLSFLNRVTAAIDGKDEENEPALLYEYLCDKQLEFIFENVWEALRGIGRKSCFKNILSVVQKYDKESPLLLEEAAVI